MKYKRFVFTLLRPTPEAIALLLKIPDLTFCMYGEEVAPDSGLLHLQGYLEVSKGMRVFGLKYRLPGYYVESANADRKANISYCSKDGKVTYLVDKICHLTN